MKSLTQLALVAGFASLFAGCGEENNLVPTIKRGPDGAYYPPSQGAGPRDAYRPPQQTVDQSQEPPVVPSPTPGAPVAPEPPSNAATTPPAPSGGETGLKPPAPAPDNAALSAERAPFGLKVLGRPDLVTSPYKPEAGPISIQDDTTGRPYPRGTEVRCPWTQKTFKVP